jgi:hypothetical protein
MQYQALLVSAILLFCCGSVSAQDKIVKINGDIIEAKIISEGVKTVTYVRFDNQTGPEYVIPRREIEKITYENGPVEKAPAPRDQSSRIMLSDKTIYEPTVVTIAPVQFTENGLGFGLSYERALDPKGIVAFYLPIAVTFNLDNGTYYNSSTGSTQNANADAMVYAMPGFKIYPTGSFGIVKYALGPSIVIGAGQKSSPVVDPGYVTTGYQTQDHIVLGIIINHSLNINPSPRIYVGLELGMGFTYLNRIGGLNQGTEFLAQGGFKIGYRF